MMAAVTITTVNDTGKKTPVFEEMANRSDPAAGLRSVREARLPILSQRWTCDQASAVKCAMT